MQIEILGSGGAVTIPRPFCYCPVCSEARQKGVPYSRSGPSLFVHGPDVLIDTPEEIKDQINRSRIRQINGCFYSHWHPDHVMGRRVWECNLDPTHWPMRVTPTDIYLPEQVALDFRDRLGSWEHFRFMESQGMVRLVELTDGETVTLNGVQIRPFRLAMDYVYGFLFEEGASRLLIVPDETKNWQPPAHLHGVDLLIMPMGVAEFQPFTGERRIDSDHPILRLEATLEETVAMVRAIAPKRAILSHIEEPEALGHDDLNRLAAMFKQQGLNIDFAYDTMWLEL